MFAGTDGGVVSGDASVVAVTGADCPELLPTASYAETVNEYEVEAVRPVAEYFVVVVVATCVPFL
jgi:hypothetical protein